MRPAQLSLAPNAKMDHTPCYLDPGQCPHKERHIRIRRSWRSVMPELVLAVVASVLVYKMTIGTLFAGLKISTGTGVEEFLVLPLSLLVFLFLAGRPLILMRDTKHELRCYRLRSATGLLSIRREQVEIPYEDILGVRCIQSVLDRILNVGTIIAWTATSDRPEVIMRGVARPTMVCELIGERIHEAIERLEGRGQ